jgi:hypothetical protein
VKFTATKRAKEIAGATMVTCFKVGRNLILLPTRKKGALDFKNT